MSSLKDLLVRNFDNLRYETVSSRGALKFHEPVYWNSLLRSQPSFLVGARGTGKTTALRAMDYSGWRSNHVEDSLPPFIGVYWKFSTSVMHAFCGNSVEEECWLKMFQHYVNLTLVDRLVATLECVASDIGGLSIFESSSTWSRTGRLLGFGEDYKFEDIIHFRKCVEEQIDSIQIWINNPSLGMPFVGAPAGEPLKVLVDKLWDSHELRDKPIYFLLDEFENLLDYQQLVFNTLLKHSGDSKFTFKIGVRPHGRRRTSTLNRLEIVSDPADYELIDIDQRMSEKDGAVFKEFASGVCRERLEISDCSPLDLDCLFPSLNWEEEALLLDASLTVKAENLRASILVDEIDPVFRAQVVNLSDVKLCFVHDWVQAHPGEGSIGEALACFFGSGLREWENRINNYGYAWLFTFANKGVRLRKYYCGWSTLCRIAGGNIRHLLDIVRLSLNRHEQEGKSLSQPVSPELQTLAVRDIGEIALEQLSFASQYGPRLRWLALNIGTLFSYYASQGLRHAPEIGEFGCLEPQSVLDADRQVVDNLLVEAAAHQLFIAKPRDKRAKSSTVPTDSTYRMHPIFAARFMFSYRSKRRLELTYSDLNILSSNIQTGVKQVIERRDRKLPTGERPDVLF